MRLEDTDFQCRVRAGIEELCVAGENSADAQRGLLNEPTHVSRRCCDIRGGGDCFIYYSCGANGAFVWTELEAPAARRASAGRGIFHRRAIEGRYRYLRA